MKQMIILSLVIFSGAATHAQKGSWYVGGTVGANIYTQKSESAGVADQSLESFTWMVAPEIGTFVTDHVQAGIGLTHSGSTHQINAIPGTSIEPKIVSTYWGASVYGRYFIGNAAFRPFVGISAFVMPGSSRGNITSVDPAKIMSFGANLNAGFGYMITPRIMMFGSIATLGFRRTTSTQNNPDRKESSTYLGFDASTQGSRFNVGVYYTFVRRELPSKPIIQQ